MVTQSPPHLGEPAGLVTGWPTYVPGLAGPCPFPYLPLIFLFGARLLLASNGLCRGKKCLGTSVALIPVAALGEAFAPHGASSFPNQKTSVPCLPLANMPPVHSVPLHMWEKWRQIPTPV